MESGCTYDTTNSHYTKKGGRRNGPYTFFWKTPIRHSQSSRSSMESGPVGPVDPRWDLRGRRVVCFQCPGPPVNPLIYQCLCSLYVLQLFCCRDGGHTFRGSVFLFLLWRPQFLCFLFPNGYKITGQNYGDSPIPFALVNLQEFGSSVVVPQCPLCSWVPPTVQ